MSEIICPRCTHVIEQHWETADGGACGASCPCHLTPAEVAHEIIDRVWAVVADIEGHTRYEDEPVEYRTEGGSWRDVVPTLREALTGTKED